MKRCKVRAAGGDCYCNQAAGPGCGNWVEATFEERVEERIERQIKLAEESNRIMERIAKVLENLVPRMKLSGNR